MNEKRNASILKALAGATLLGTWAAFRAFHVVGAEDIISFCQTGLTALMAHYLTAWKDDGSRQGTRKPTPKTPAPGDSPQSHD